MNIEVNFSDPKKVLNLIVNGVITIDDVGYIENDDLEDGVCDITLEIYNLQMSRRDTSSFLTAKCQFLSKENLQIKLRVIIESVCENRFNKLCEKHMGTPPQGITPSEVIDPKDLETLRGSNQFRSWLNTREDWTGWFGFKREFKPVDVYPSLESMRSWAATSKGVFVSLSGEYESLGYKRKGFDKHLRKVDILEQNGSLFYKVFFVQNKKVLDKLRGMINDLETEKQRLRFEVGDDEGYYLYNVPTIKGVFEEKHSYEYVCNISKEIEEDEFSLFYDFEYSTPLDNMGVCKGYVTKIEPSRHLVHGEFEKVTKHLDNLGYLWTTTKERSREYLVVLNESVEVAKSFYQKAYTLYRESEEERRSEAIQKLQSEWNTLDKLDNIIGEAFWCNRNHEARIHPIIKDGEFEYKLDSYDYFGGFSAEYIYERAYDFFKSYKFEKEKAAWVFEQQK